MSTRPIADITIGVRHRRDLGDIDSLARSIADVAHIRSKRDRRSGIGARCRQQGRASLPAWRHAREAAAAHAAMGEVLHHSTGNRKRQLAASLRLKLDASSERH
jgi:hypothetical protein